MYASTGRSREIWQHCAFTDIFGCHQVWCRFLLGARKQATSGLILTLTKARLCFLCFAYSLLLCPAKRQKPPHKGSKFHILCVHTRFTFVAKIRGLGLSTEVFLYQWIAMSSVYFDPRKFPFQTQETKKKKKLSCLAWCNLPPLPINTCMLSDIFASANTENNSLVDRMTPASDFAVLPNTASICTKSDSSWKLVYLRN